MINKLHLFSLVFVPISLLSLGFYWRQSVAQTYTQNNFKVIVTAENAQDIPPEVIDSIKFTLDDQWRGQIPLDNQFQLPSIRLEANWGITNLYYKTSGQKYDQTDSPINNSFTVISAKTIEGKWVSSLSTEPLAADLARLIPDDEFTYEAKSTLISHFPSPYKTTAINIDYKLPWSQNGPKFFFSGVRTQNTYPCPNNSGWHGALPYLGGQRCHALDFAPRLTTTVRNADILSPVTGYVEHLCKNPGTQKQSALAIRATNSNQIIGIWHLDKNTIPGKIKQGELITQGELLGRMVEGNVNESQSTCPLISYGTHIHIVAPHKSFEIDSYSFTEDSNVIYQGTSTAMVNFQNKDLVSTNAASSSNSTTGCTPPSSGDWIINSNCTLTSSARISNNLVINDGYTLSLNPNVALDMNLRDYKILVKNNAKLIINSGAKIY